MLKINRERVLKFSIVLLILFLLIGYYKPEIKLNSIKNVLNTSQLTGNIYILGNGGWIDVRNAGYCTGSGTSLDPYIIQDLNLNDRGYEHVGAIEIESSDVYFIIENCTISNAVDAVRLHYVQNGIIVDNRLFNNWEGVVLGPNCKNNIIKENLIYSNGVYGILLYQCSHNSIIDNVISNNNDVGISLFQSNNIDILRNTITSGETGITLNESQNTIISQNTVENAIYGITISRNINNQITNNILRNNEFGLYIIESSCNTITGNTFSGNGEDIHGEQGICSTFIIYLSVGILLGIPSITYFLIKRKKKISRKRELKGLVYIRPEQTQAPQKLVAEEIIEPQTILRVIEVIEPPPTVNLETSLIRNEILATGEQKEESLAKEELIEEKCVLESEECSKEEIAAIEITEQPQQQERLEELKKAQETLEEETLQVSEGKDEEEFKMEDVVPSSISQIEVKEKGITESSPPLIPQMIKQTIEDRKFVKEKEMKVIDRKDVHFCTNCGKQLVDTWKICAYCGLKIRKDLWKTESKIERETISLEKEFEMPIDESQKFPVIEDIKQDFKEKIKSIELTKIISEERTEESINEVQEIPLKKSEPSLLIEVPKVREETKPIEEEPVEPKPVKNLCPFCGIENILEKKYCKQCGYKLKK